MLYGKLSMRRVYTHLKRADMTMSPVREGADTTRMKTLSGLLKTVIEMTSTRVGILVISMQRSLAGVNNDSTTALK